MTIDEFRTTLHEGGPAASLPPLLAALWWDAKGNFDRTHEIADQGDGSQESAWVHAYLHRKQGDPDNAGYWYKRAHQPSPENSPDEEWRQIATVLLHRHARK